MTKELKPISWEAEEYIIRKHDAWWYFGLAVIVILFSIIAVLLQGWTFLILVILSSVTILISNLRPPRKLTYELNERGLIESGKLYKYSDYRAFGILKEDGHFSAILIPKKRFSLQVKVYFPFGSGEQIVDQLGSKLPMEEAKLDIIDKIVNFLRI